MDTPETAPAADTGKVDSAQKLIVSGWIHLGPPGSAPVEVRREMSLLGCDGAALGTVAAVVADRVTQAITHILFCRLNPDPEYRLVPVALIERVDEAVVHLHLAISDVNGLPRRATS